MNTQELALLMLAAITLVACADTSEPSPGDPPGAPSTPAEWTEHGEASGDPDPGLVPPFDNSRGLPSGEVVPLGEDVSHNGCGAVRNLRWNDERARPGEICDGGYLICSGVHAVTCQTEIPAHIADSDGDTIPDALERFHDIDGDGFPNAQDLDADGDRIPDSEDLDYDGDGHSDEVEGRATGRDTDRDGIPDFVDQDSDNDFLADRIETAHDLDGDGIPNFADFDADGDSTLDDEDRDYDGDGVDNISEGLRSMRDSDDSGYADYLEFTEFCPGTQLSRGEGRCVDDRVEVCSELDGVIVLVQMEVCEHELGERCVVDEDARAARCECAHSSRVCASETTVTGCQEVDGELVFGTFECGDIGPQSECAPPRGQLLGGCFPDHRDCVGPYSRLCIGDTASRCVRDQETGARVPEVWLDDGAGEDCGAIGLVCWDGYCESPDYVPEAEQTDSPGSDMNWDEYWRDRCESGSGSISIGPWWEFWGYLDRAGDGYCEYENGSYYCPWAGDWCARSCTSATRCLPDADPRFEGELRVDCIPVDYCFSWAVSECAYPDVDCSPSQAEPMCGDGVVDAGEQCDTGPRERRGGCLECEIRDGWACQESHGRSFCGPVVGTDGAQIDLSELQTHRWRWRNYGVAGALMWLVNESDRQLQLEITHQPDSSWQAFDHVGAPGSLEGSLDSASEPLVGPGHTVQVIVGVALPLPSSFSNEPDTVAESWAALTIRGSASLRFVTPIE